MQHNIGSKKLDQHFSKIALAKTKHYSLYDSYKASFSMKQVYLQKLATKLVINISQNVHMSTGNDALTNPGKTEMFRVDQAFFVIIILIIF